jgi:hypothetical protein
MTFRGMGHGFGALAFLLGMAVACSTSPEPATQQEAELPYRLSDDECDNLIEITTERVRLESIDGPSKAQQALDAANPAAADLSQYILTLAVEQAFTNLLDRKIIVEEVSGTFRENATDEGYQTAYDLDAPLELGPHETRSLTFRVPMPADRLSASYVLGLAEGSALGMTIAPEVLLNVPESDNCGYPDGMRVQGKSGTVEVQRPVEPSPLLDLLGGLLKAAGHA